MIIKQEDLELLLCDIQQCGEMGDTEWYSYWISKHV